VEARGVGKERSRQSRPRIVVVERHHHTVGGGQGEADWHVPSVAADRASPAP
jgi:hypothetical protein